MTAPVNTDIHGRLCELWDKPVTVELVLVSGRSLIGRVVNVSWESVTLRSRRRHVR